MRAKCTNGWFRDKTTSRSNRYEQLRQTTAFQWDTPWAQICVYLLSSIRSYRDCVCECVCVCPLPELSERATFAGGDRGRTKRNWRKKKIWEKSREHVCCTFYFFLRSKIDVRYANGWTRLVHVRRNTVSESQSRVCQSIYEQIIFVNFLMTAPFVPAATHKWSWVRKIRHFAFATTKNTESNDIRFWNSIFFVVVVVPPQSHALTHTHI